MAGKDSKNKANEVDTSGWEEENISFPPYFTFQAVGEYIIGSLEKYDARDPEFPRYVFKAAMDTQCHQGKKGEEKAVVVKPGEFFTISAYGGLNPEVLQELVGLPMKLTVTGKRDVGKPSPMLVFQVLMSPESKRLLAERRLARQKEAIAELPEGLR